MIAILLLSCERKYSWCGERREEEREKDNVGLQQPSNFDKHLPSPVYPPHLPLPLSPSYYSPWLFDSTLSAWLISIVVILALE